MFHTRKYIECDGGRKGPTDFHSLTVQLSVSVLTIIIDIKTVIFSHFHNDLFNNEWQKTTLNCSHNYSRYICYKKKKWFLKYRRHSYIMNCWINYVTNMITLWKLRFTLTSVKVTECCKVSLCAKKLTSERFFPGSVINQRLWCCF